MLRTLLLAGFGGGVTAAVVWAIASRALDSQLRQGATQLSFGLQQGRGALEARLVQGRLQLADQIRAEVQSQVPPVVRSTLEQKFREYNITPQTGANISTILRYGETVGLL